MDEVIRSSMLREEVSKRILEQLLDLDTFETSLWGFGGGRVGATHKIIQFIRHTQ